MILVTGGAGYIGSHVLLALSDQEIVVVDDFSTGHEWAVPEGIEIARGSITDAPWLDDVLRRYRPKTVVHMAARTEAFVSVVDPLAFWRVNVGGTTNLLSSMSNHGVDDLVFSSSAAVYGNAPTVPIPESCRSLPTNPYGETKLACEMMIRAWVNAGRHTATIFRYFNAAGADVQARVGEAHDPETHLVPLCLAVAGGRSAEISLFGTDYETHDGTCVRDYVHVEDIAAAHAALLEREQGPGEVTCVNLGSGVASSVLDVVAAAEAASGRRVATREATRREGDPVAILADVSAAGEQLGWAPQRSGLAEIVASAWRWWEVHHA